ncbi:MAG: hypothetical protein JSW39_30380 [Desulfobacterales bacterium]|nr:MAG: hypothetical protein JSW39_30380 [Desulfobacterales bacterium]
MIYLNTFKPRITAFLVFAAMIALGLLTGYTVLQAEKTDISTVVFYVG